MLQRAITLLIVSASFCSLWTNSWRGERDAHEGQLGMLLNMIEGIRKDKEEEEEEGKQGWTRWEVRTGQYSDFFPTNASYSCS